MSPPPDPSPPEGDVDVATFAPSPRTLWAANATVFASSACVMVLELVAGRLVAAHLGSSIYTWTSVIGIVLAGLAVGNYAGGRLADRFPARPALAVLFAASSAAAFAVLLVNPRAGELRSLWLLPWPARVASHVALVFFVPSCLLGTIGPVVTKMALDRGLPTGRTVGGVYAWGVVGSLAGTFATGFVLVALLGTRTIVVGVGVVLAGVAVLYGAGSRPGRLGTLAWAAVAVGLSALTTGTADAAREWGERLGLREELREEVLLFDESRYSAIRVERVPGEPDERRLYLDTLLHSQVDLRAPLELQYDYARIFGAVTDRLHPERGPIRTLTLGGGGYVFPRYLELRHPGGHHDVVEIDPAVTRAAHAEFGLPVTTAIRSHHEDARVFVDRLRRAAAAGRAAEPYDLIFVDAVQNFSVPFQLTTREFAGELRGLLAPDGALLFNLIDDLAYGGLLASVTRTLEEVFPHVQILVEGLPVEQFSGRSTFVVLARDEPLDAADLSAHCPTYPCRISAMDADARERWLGGGLVLTDDHAPVENLLAAVARDYGRERAYGDYARAITDAVVAGEDARALELALQALEDLPDVEGLPEDVAKLRVKRGTDRFRAGDPESALAEFEAALALDPDSAPAHLGALDCLHRLGRVEESLAHFTPALLREQPLARYNYAATLARLGRIPEALEQYRLVTEAMPRFAPAHADLGTALALVGDLAGARHHLERALALDPRLPSARANLEQLRRDPRSRAGTGGAEAPGEAAGGDPAPGPG